MLEKDPQNVSAIWPTIAQAWIIFLAILGGAVSYIHKVRTGATRRFNLPELVGDMFISGFVGIITFYLCRWAQLDELLSAAFVGIAGHMGSRALFLAEKAIERKIDCVLKKLTGRGMEEPSTAFPTPTSTTTEEEKDK